MLTSLVGLEYLNLIDVNRYICDPVAAVSIHLYTYVIPLCLTAVRVYSDNPRIAWIIEPIRYPRTTNAPSIVQTSSIVGVLTVRHSYKLPGRTFNHFNTRPIVSISIFVKINGQRISTAVNKRHAAPILSSSFWIIVVLGWVGTTKNRYAISCVCGVLVVVKSSWVLASTISSSSHTPSWSRSFTQSLLQSNQLGMCICRDVSVRVVVAAKSIVHLLLQVHRSHQIGVPMYLYGNFLIASAGLVPPSRNVSLGPSK